MVSAAEFLSEVTRHQFLASVPHLRDGERPGMLLTGRQWRGYAAQFEPGEADMLRARCSFVHQVYANRLAAATGVRGG